MRTRPPKDTPPATWAEAVERFMGRLTERRKSAKTIDCYRGELLAFGEWYKSEFDEPAALSGIMESDPAAWLNWLRKSQKLKAATINKKLAALKSFLRWSEIKGFSEPLEMPEPLKRKRGAIRWLTKNQEHSLLRAVHKGSVLRDRALIVFLLRVGARIEEAATLQRGDLELGVQKGWANITGKGDKDRRVPIPNDAVKLLSELVATLDDAGEKDPHVFQGQRGGLTVSALHRIIVKYTAEAGLPGMSAHNLRHTFAKRFIDAGGPITTLAHLLGHSNINTTMIYLRPGEEDLERAVANHTVDGDDDDAPSRPKRRARRI
jgi:site-specific recombinase XerD